MANYKMKSIESTVKVVKIFWLLKNRILIHFKAKQSLLYA